MAVPTPRPATADRADRINPRALAQLVDWVEQTLRPRIGGNYLLSADAVAALVAQHGAEFAASGKRLILNLAGTSACSAQGHYGLLRKVQAQARRRMGAESL